jgi:hypothetical protein
MEPSVGCIRVCGLLMFGACARSVSAGTCVYGLENWVREMACVGRAAYPNKWWRARADRQ